MNIGMLWFDNDPKATLDAKIGRAAAYYREKYGKIPTLCFVNPKMLLNGKNPPGLPENGSGFETQQKRFTECGVEVRPNPAVLPNHLWIGVNGAA